MRIKLFTASGMPEAMSAIRAELGPDAVILGSRRIRGGIEVTAARDDPDPAPMPPPRLAARESCPLRAHGTPEALAARLSSAPLPFALSVALRFRPLDADALACPIVFLGPPGAGKTLTVARLATRMVLAGAGPRLLTADTSRACAFEQLAAFATLLDVPLAPYSTDPTPKGPTLIDTAGLDPFTRSDRDEITSIVSASKALAVLVLPGGIDAGEAVELAAAFAECGASRLIATRLDIARRLGGILAAAERLPLAEAGIGASAADGLAPMTPERLASILQRRQRPWSFP